MYKNEQNEYNVIEGDIMISVTENQRRVNLGERLRKLRTMQGLKQSDMARKLAVSPTSYMLYEQGKREPSIKNLITISNILDTSIDTLLGQKNTDFLEAKNFWKSIGYDIETDDKVDDIVLFTLPFDKKIIVFADKAAFIKFTKQTREKVEAEIFEKKKKICADISSRFYEKSVKKECDK